MKANTLIILLGMVFYGFICFATAQRSTYGYTNISSDSDESSSEEGDESSLEENYAEESSEEKQVKRIQLKDLLTKQFRVTNIEAVNMLGNSLRPPVLPTAKATKLQKPSLVASHRQIQSFETNKNDYKTVTHLRPPANITKSTSLNTNDNSRNNLVNSPNSLIVKMETAAETLHAFPTQRPPITQSNSFASSALEPIRNEDPAITDNMESFTLRQWRYDSVTLSPASSSLLSDNDAHKNSISKQNETITNSQKTYSDYVENNKGDNIANDKTPPIDSPYAEDAFQYNPWIHNFYDKSDDGSYVFGYSLPNGVRRYERRYNTDSKGHIVEGFYVELRHFDHMVKYELRCYRADSYGYHPFKVEYLSRPPLVQRNIEPEVDCLKDMDIYS